MGKDWGRDTMHLFSKDEEVGDDSGSFQPLDEADLSGGRSTERIGKREVQDLSGVDLPTPTSCDKD